MRTVITDLVRLEKWALHHKAVWRGSLSGSHGGLLHGAEIAAFISNTTTKLLSTPHRPPLELALAFSHTQHPWVTAPRNRESSSELCSSLGWRIWFRSTRLLPCGAPSRQISSLQTNRRLSSRMQHACPRVERKHANVASAKQAGRKYMPSRLPALSCEPPSQSSAPSPAYSPCGRQLRPPTTSSSPPTTTATSPCPGMGFGAPSATSAPPEMSLTGSFAMLRGDLGFWPIRGDA